MISGVLTARCRKKIAHGSHVEGRHVGIDLAHYFAPGTADMRSSAASSNAGLSQSVLEVAAK